jgi:hypothetical protein
MSNFVVAELALHKIRGITAEGSPLWIFFDVQLISCLTGLTFKEELDKSSNYIF